MLSASLTGCIGKQDKGVGCPMRNHLAAIPGLMHYLKHSIFIQKWVSVQNWSCTLWSQAPMSLTVSLEQSNLFGVPAPEILHGRNKNPWPVMISCSISMFFWGFNAHPHLLLSNASSWSNFSTVLLAHLGPSWADLAGEADFYTRKAWYFNVFYQPNMRVSCQFSPT